MQARALKTFQSKYGLIRAGTTFQPEPGYARALERNKLVEILDDDRKPAPGEQREDKSIPRAPHEKDAGKGQTGGDTARQPEDGTAPKSSASPRGQASRGKTLTTSTVGGRKSARKKPITMPPTPAKSDE